MRSFQSGHVVAQETQLPKDGTQFVDEAREGQSSIAYREAVKADVSPSDVVSAIYSWTPGTELARVAPRTRLT